ncbi:Tol-Pal system beta propeller repeat protein TolB [Marinicella sp. S1101]|uniref:Tol-Pal system beta propeller repeat protein TolB n=1 Tax=Marinicella marina TaxID=2996016 RepID=UPI002260D33D|nr:Tol-Pal system beta propeller repeat protein TolB [Marinicella marina]MCX7553185.1 Tol-Pal system beta propeller repeat protein TolB [Marinicella marina]MDJ1138917.1 Tol-Pal system beta propeller repeat protein TolB [Marinicella marina]
MQRLMLLSLLITGFIFNHTSHAQLNIVIQDGNESALPIAVADFVNNGDPLAHDMAEIIRNDLASSGQFKALDKELLVDQPRSGDDINFGTWRLLGADYLSYGDISYVDANRIEVRFRLSSVAEQKQLLALTLPLSRTQARAGAHYIADRIYEEIIGVPGVFSTKLAYVTAEKIGADYKYQLIVADADGYAPQSLVTSKEPLLSPTWSPDGKKLAYVSFEQGNSAIYLQDLSTGARTLMTNFKGINGAPKFSPNGQRLAITLSKSGNPEIYTINTFNKQLTQITNHWGIDTEPEWAPDGQSLFFTSDRGGKPQIYEVTLANKNVKRITFQGDYNARASVSPDGKYLAMVHGNNNRYQIALLHRPSNTLQLLSQGALDETPSFAPNGAMVLYATKNSAGQGLLRAVSTDAHTSNDLVQANVDVREPSWSPLLK